MRTFFELGLETQLGKKNKVMKIHSLMNWERLQGYLKKIKQSDPTDMMN